MRKRIITSLVAAALFLPVLYFSEHVVFALVIAACAVIATSEMLRCIGALHQWWISVPYLVLSALLPICAYYLDSAKVMYVGMFALSALVLYSFVIMTFSRGKADLSLVSRVFFTEFYIIAAFTSLCLLRYSVDVGKYVYLICFIGAWATDIFAYFCGLLFGKRKLIPDISPKKTVEGSIGGTLCCVGVVELYGFVICRISPDAIHADFLMLGISGLLIAAVAQVGDLLMSAIKRTYGVKDYGRLFPGHGGVLDRFDSVMAVSLVLCLITSLTDLFVVI